MKRAIFTCLLLLPFLIVSSQDKCVPADHLQLGGYINQRLSSSVNNRIMAQRVDRLVDVFKIENRHETHLWQTEFWGKWFTSAVLAYKYSGLPALSEKLDNAVSKLIETQSADGYIGNYAADARLQEWDIWGRKYCMLGLLAYYQLKGDQKALIAAKKVADNLIDDLKKSDNIIVTKGNYRGMAASSVLEPVVQLYTLTKEQKYLDFAKRIVSQWSLPEGPQLIEKSKVDVAHRFQRPAKWYSPQQGQKAYEMMSCYEGLLELYRVTGEERFKQAVVNTWDNIKATEINIAGSGASTEMWFGGASLQASPVNHYQEVCVTVTWIKFSLQLFRLTGEAKYAEAAERSYYNALLGSLDWTGSTWAKYTPLNGQRLPGSEQCGMGLNCCEASGPRALFLLPFYAVTRGDNTLMVNYFIEGKYETQLNNNKIVVEQKTVYPQNGQVEIKLHIPSASFFKFKIRIPDWAKDCVIKLNGKMADGEVKNGTYYTISREWKDGDIIELNMPMQGRIISVGQTPKSMAVLWGPVVLSRDAVFGDSTAMGAVLQPVVTKQGYLNLRPVKTAGNCWMRFKATFLPESYREYGAKPVEISLCDYASAGNIKKQSLFQTWFPQLINYSKSENY